MHHRNNVPSSVSTNGGDANGEDEGSALLIRSTVESWPHERVLEPHDADTGPHEHDEDGNRVHRTCLQQFKHRLYDFYEKFDFPIHVLIGILIAWLYPPLGAVYVAPMVTANWVAVCYIFVLFGLGVRTEEFTSALTKMPFNALVQVYNFGFISAVVFGVTRLLALLGVLTQNLADGMAICGCLPMSINVGIVLTMAAGGDEAVAIFNTSFGNFVGVFLSPALILGYLGTIGYVNVGQVYMKLSLIVIVPLIVGQLIQRLVKPIREFYFKHKKTFKKTAEWALVFIIFTIFSRNFYAGTKVALGQVFILIACILCFITSFMAIMWNILRLLYKDRPLLRVTGTFISIQKTIALGVPLITSIYGGDPNLAYYTLPILCWHPLQLIIGSLLVPSMVKFLAREKERAAALDESSVSDEESGIEAPRRGRPKRGDDDDDDDSGSQGGSGSDTDQAGSVVKEGEDAATAKSYSASECSSPC
jgi:sodium/bile acid cotransporter 7